MIPLIAGAVGTVSIGLSALTYGAAAGMGYGLGRKWGRKVCEVADSFEARIKDAFTNTTTVVIED